MSKTILLADDSVTIQKVIELTFMDQDYEVVAVSNGDDALEQLEELAPDLVIADVHMPGASGYEVARRSKDRRPDVPVLLLVGTFEPFDSGETEASGADAHLKKPFDSQELLQLVERLMAAAPETAAAESAAAEAPAAESLAAEAAAPAAEVAPPAAPTGPAEGPAEVTWDNLDFEAMETPEPPTPAAAPAEEPPPAEQPTERPWDFDSDRETPFELSPAPGETTWPPPSAAPPDLEKEEPFLLGEDDAELELEVEEEESYDLEIEEELEPLRLEADDLDVELPGVEEVAGSAGGEALPDLDETESARVVGFQPSIAERESSSAAGEGRETEVLPNFQLGAEAEPRPTPEPEAPPTAEMSAAEAAAAPSEDFAGGAPGDAPGAASLSDADVERIARRVVELLGAKLVREVAWEVIPDLAEVAIKARIEELESQVE